MGLRAFAIAILVLIIGVAFQAALPVMANERAFKAFIQEIKQAAQKDGIDAKHLKALDALKSDPEVQRLAARQPEYVKPIWAYLTHMVTPERLSLGRDQLTSREAFLDGLEEKYGVPRGILIAIWGVETNYGGNKGSFSVLRSLATLGYEGKRAD
ncbi:MAG: lytic murein transglycosylase, partial [Alphaproteobacteria bacterium]|nr:lytic murein transglycosylase [Alphaproteobacteria bacterium]